MRSTLVLLLAAFGPGQWIASEVEPVGCHQDFRQDRGAEGRPTSPVELPSNAGHEEAQQSDDGDHHHVDVEGSALTFEVLCEGYDFSQHVPNSTCHIYGPARRVAKKQSAPNRKQYKKLRYDGVWYELGSTVMINEYHDSKAYATLMQINEFTQQTGADHRERC